MTRPAISLSDHRQRPRVESVLAVGALLLIAGVWAIGSMRAKADVASVVRKIVPEAGHLVRLDDDVFECWSDASSSVFLGYVAFGSSDGYGGPLQVGVTVDSEGEINNVVLASHKETPAWMTRVRRSGFFNRLPGKPYTDSFVIGADVDGVTGATYSSKALAAATLDGGRKLAKRLELPVSPPPKPQIVFGIPEVVLLALFAVGFSGHQGRFRYQRQARWLSMLTGLVVLGFIYNSPVTLAYITKMVLGYWPQWQTNLYWYFLVGGILFVFTIDNKNPYCQWFCPFGAAQECMGVVGGAKSVGVGNFGPLLKWLQRGLALAAILVGLYFRSPGLASFELFGALFSFIGSNIELLALGLVLLASLFVKRPWCRYLCPITPVVDLIAWMRRLVKRQWKSL